MDFLITRRLLVLVEKWFVPLVEPFLPLKRIPIEGGFHFDFKEHSARTVILGKGVRIISGLRGAMILADCGYVTECSTLLRVIDDFIAEAEFLVDGYRSDKSPKGYDDFIEQYFTPLPRNAEEYAHQAKKRWVPRDAVLAGSLKSITFPTTDVNKVRKSAKFVTHMF